MASRRWWRNWSVLLILGAMPGALVLGAGTPVVPSADDFEKASAADLPRLRAQIDAAVGLMTASDRFSFVSTRIVPDFGRADHGINSKRDEVRLNTAIMLDEVNTYATQGIQKEMLASNDAAVRYWGARGLGDISSSLKLAGATGPSVGALQAAGTKPETSSVVMQEILRSLGDGKFEDVAATVKVLQAIANQMKTAQPEVQMLQASAQALDFVAKAASAPGGLPAAGKVDAATAADELGSFSAQWEMAVFKTVSASDPSVTNAPADFVDAVQKVETAAAKVLGVVAGKSYTAPTGSTPAEVNLNANSLLGTPGGRGGTVQGDIKGVPVPPAITPAP